MSFRIAEAFLNLNVAEIRGIVAEELKKGNDPFDLVRECQAQMAKIGNKFESGDYFLSELIMSAKIFEKAIDVLSPNLKGKGDVLDKNLGKILLGTPKGDIHDLGKNIFRLLAKAEGFEVIDLGVDVTPQKFLESLEQVEPSIIGMSGMITTVYPSMKEVVDLINRRGIRQKFKIIIGGGATGEETRRYVGADAQTLDAAEGVRMCREFIAKNGKEVTSILG